jgi:hypothetical protein
LPDEQAPTPLPVNPIVREEGSRYGSGRFDDTCIDGPDGSVAVQESNHPLLNRDICLLSGLNSDGYNSDTCEAVQLLQHGGTSPSPYQLGTTEHTSSKHKQTFQDGRALKRTRLEPADTAGGARNATDSRVSAVVLI